MKYNLIITTLLVAVTLPAVTLAEDDSATGTRKFAPIRREFNDSRKDIMEDARRDQEDILEARRTLGTTTREQRMETRDALRENHSEKIEALRENREEMKAAIEERRKEMQENRKVNKEERRIRLAEKAKTQVQEVIARIFKNLNDRIEKLSNIDARIATKLSELQASGTDLSSTTPLFVIAQSDLSKAKTDIAAAKAAADEQVATTTSKEAIRSFVKIAEESIKTAGEAYRKVLKSLKSTNASSTATTTSSI